MARRHVLVTGGSGFIGSHLVEAELSFDPHVQVTVVDDLSTGRPINLEPLRCERLRVVRGDAAAWCTAAADAVAAGRGLGEVLHAPAPRRLDVFHLAASVGVARVMEQPAAMIRTNVADTAAVVAACERLATRTDLRLLVASSSEVYGKCPKLPLSEEMELVFGPTTASRWAYGMTKALDEHLVLDMASRGHHAVAARLFNTIGPRQVGRYGMVVPRFVEQACRGGTLVLHGDGQQTRTFCDVRDVVDALRKLAGTPAAAGQIVNVGGDTETSVRELAERVLHHAAAHGCPPAAMKHVDHASVYGPGFEDPPRRLPDTTRLRKLTGWSPRHGLDATLADLVQRVADAAAGHPAATRGAPGRPLASNGPASTRSTLTQPVPTPSAPAPAPAPAPPNPDHAL